MISLIHPIWIPLSALDGNIFFLIPSSKKRWISQRISAVFFMFFPEAIHFTHAAKLP